jgi:hypothetical protein
MGDIIKLFDRNNNAKSRSPQDVVDRLQKLIDTDKIPPDAKFIAIYTIPAKEREFHIGFNQCGLSTSEMIMLLEIAKQDIYRTQMVKP